MSSAMLPQQDGEGGPLVRPDRAARQPRALSLPVNLILFAKDSALSGEERQRPVLPWKLI